VEEVDEVQKMMTGRERFMAALNNEPMDRVPVFPLLMFLAVDRAGITYRQYASDSRALVGAQLLVQERFDLDAITVCSDAFRLTADLGADMVFPVGGPPYARRPVIDSSTDLQALPRPDPTDPRTRMGDRVRGVDELARAVSNQVAMLGWIDMPFAEACSVCGVAEFMLLMKDEPRRAHAILSLLTGIVSDFSVAQVQAGADMIGAGDAATSLISPRMYQEFALPYEQQVCQATHNVGGLVKLHVCGNTTHLLNLMATCGADLFNVDHMVPLERARDVYSAHDKCYKGNLDPVAHIMQATPEECRERAHDCISLAQGTRYMLSAGCEIPAETPDEVFCAFCDAPKTYVA
jgi:MtaA/CmuA family methyltransferase